MRVAVMGAGNGGCGVAYDWAAAGHEVSLFSSEDYPGDVEAVRQAGGITSRGVLEGFAPVASAGHDLAATLAGADLVFVVGPAYSTAPFAAAARPHLREGQRVVVCPGSCAGAIVFKNALGGDLDDERWPVAETSTLPYAVRITSPGVIEVFHKLERGIFLAALPWRATATFVELLHEVYPGIEPAASVWQTTLQNGNPVIHPAVTLLNTARIDGPGDFRFYEDGITEAVGRLIAAVDAERLAIAAALGFPVLSEPAIGVRQGYMQEENYGTGYSRATGFRGILAQGRLDNRYLTEDVGYSMVFLTDLARRVGVPTPTLDAVIELSGVVLARDFRREGQRTLASLGLGDYGADDLRAL